MAPSKLGSDLSNRSDQLQPDPAAPRRTDQRAAIAAALAGSSEALTAKQLHRKLGDAVGLATVYRNLQRMADAGAADSIRLPSGEIAFRVCGRGHHHHLTCRACGTVVEVHDCELAGWAAELADRHGFSAVEHQTELFGLCPRCSGDNVRPDGIVKH